MWRLLMLISIPLVDSWRLRKSGSTPASCSQVSVQPPTSRAQTGHIVWLVSKLTEVKVSPISKAVTHMLLFEAFVTVLHCYGNDGIQAIDSQAECNGVKASDVYRYNYFKSWLIFFSRFAVFSYCCKRVVRRLDAAGIGYSNRFWFNRYGSRSCTVHFIIFIFCLHIFQTQLAVCFNVAYGKEEE